MTRTDFCKFFVVSQITHNKYNTVDPSIVQWVKQIHYVTFEDEFNYVFKQLDKDGSGNIDKSEFIIWFVGRFDGVKKLDLRKISKSIKKVFTSFDSDKSGEINKEEFKLFFWWVQA